MLENISQRYGDVISDHVTTIKVEGQPNKQPQCLKIPGFRDCLA